MSATVMKSALPRPNVLLRGCGLPPRGIVNEVIAHLQASKCVRVAVCLHGIQRAVLKHQKVGVWCPRWQQQSPVGRQWPHVNRDRDNFPKLYCIPVLCYQPRRHSKRNRNWELRAKSHLTWKQKKVSTQDLPALLFPNSRVLISYSFNKRVN